MNIYSLLRGSFKFGMNNLRPFDNLECKYKHNCKLNSFLRKQWVQFCSYQLLLISWGSILKRKLLLTVTIWIKSISVTLLISTRPTTTVKTHYSVLCVLVCSKLVSIVVYNNKLGFMKNLSQTLEFQENSCRLSTCWHEYSCHGTPCSHQLVSIFIRVENTRLFTNSSPCFPCSVWGKEFF